MNLPSIFNIAVILWTLGLTFADVGLTFPEVNFNGEIHRSVHTEFSPEHEEMFLMSPNNYPPIERYVLTEAKYTIQDDTLIVERFDGFGDLNMVTVQISDKVYSNSGGSKKILSTPFVDVSAFEHEMDLVEDWEEVKPNKMIGNNKRTEIEVTADMVKIYPGMKKRNRAFSELFYNGTLIVEQKRSFMGSTRVMKNTRVEEKVINCSLVLERYNFSM